jgi:hypothetical protein
MKQSLPQTFPGFAGKIIFARKLIRYDYAETFICQCQHGVLQGMRVRPRFDPHRFLETINTGLLFSASEYWRDVYMRRIM